MEVELDPRAKPLAFKVKATSRESPSQKASHVLDSDLKNHWSTGTNTKEWILLELDEPCLLSHIRIYNKSVLEWEISVGLRYKPETFAKVRSRCEAPRRDMMYPMNYTACRYVKISCLRGNPIAIFFIQLMGVSVPGLEPDFQPVINYLLPHIILRKQDVDDVHLQLLQDLTNRLASFLPQLEADLKIFSDEPDPTMRFLAMLAGPLYPILRVVTERESVRLAGNASDFESSKSGLPSLPALTVSSNFEPRRSRNALPSFSSTSNSLVFRLDAIIALLRKAYKDPHLGTLCRMASRILMKLSPLSSYDPTQSVFDELSNSESFRTSRAIDYSNLFGEEFRIPGDDWDTNYIDLLDIKAVEEGVLHVLYACASQPILCSKFAESSSDLWSALPLVQALLTALRPNISGFDQVDDNFSQWKQPLVQHALSQIVASSTSALYRPLVHGCAGYLSFSPSNAKAACVLIDLCSGVLSPWISQVIAKVDLAVELVEDLLGTIQGARHAVARARAAIKYIVLALSGQMDDIMIKFKEVKHQILFLLEIMEPYLDPSLTPLKSTIAFGNLSSIFSENQEQNCSLALDVIRTAVRKSAVLPYLESEWRRGSVTPSVLLLILEPHLQLPPDIDLRKCPVSGTLEPQQTSVSPIPCLAGPLLKPPGHDDADFSIDTVDDVSSLFAPPEIRDLSLTTAAKIPVQKSPDPNQKEEKGVKYEGEMRNDACPSEFSILRADYFQLLNYRDCELRASEFRRLALDLLSQNDITPEGHYAAIDALLLAAECYVNPFSMMPCKASPKLISKSNIDDISRILEKSDNNLDYVARLENKRDKLVLQILIEAADLDLKYQKAAIDRTENGEVFNLSVNDMSQMDAITLVRKNQSLLFKFLIDCLLRDQQSLREILMQSLVFLLNSATELCGAPERVVDIILESADYLNGLILLYCRQFKEGNSSSLVDSIKAHEIRRHWMLLQKLVIAASGGEEDSDISTNTGSGIRFVNLIPPSAWMQKIPDFSSSSSPLVRFVGWMAVSRNAKLYLTERLFLVSDLSELSSLLTIFADELALVDNIVEQKDEKVEDQSFHVVYPHVSKFIPDLKTRFNEFGMIILEAVALQLRSLPSYVVPDLLVWFSDLCSWPLLRKEEEEDSSFRSYFLFKGFISKNAKAIILYILQAIVTEHMEAMVPEVPRIADVLVTLCRTSYCGVPFLESIMGSLKPIITYSLSKVCDVEHQMDDELCPNFESLCFNELVGIIGQCDMNQVGSDEKVFSRAPTILVLTSVFPDLSFKRKRKILQNLVFWADFATFEPTTSFCDYLCAFQALLDSCKSLLVETLRVLGVIPLDAESCHDNFELHSFFLNDAYDKLKSHVEGTVISSQKGCHLSVEEALDFSIDLESLVLKLNQSLELCCKLHYQLAKKLTLVSAECFVYSKCLSSVSKKNSPSLEGDFSDDHIHWKIGLEGLANIVLGLQETNCWEVASMMLDCLLGAPHFRGLENVIGSVCSAIKISSVSSPTITWRLQTDKWLLSLFKRGNECLHGSEMHLANLFCSLLGHHEPEQRFVALKHLHNLVGHSTNGSPSCELMLSPLVSRTWDLVIVLAFSDMSLPLRARALALLVDCVSFAERTQLQALLTAADRVLPSLTNLVNQKCEGPMTQLSLALLTSVCIYSPVEDIRLIPQNVWRQIETLSKTEGKHDDLGRKACQALCRMKIEGNEAKEVLKDVLSASYVTQEDPDFASTREALLQVLSKLTSAQSYFDFFSNKIEEKFTEIEEAEIEMELVQKEQLVGGLSKDSKDWRQLPFLANFEKDSDRLQEIKDGIRSLEKERLKEEIIARRQKKLLLRRARQKYLEEAALHEAELLKELDRERTSEAEKEIERQRLLEVERAKTRELRHNLDMEKEKQTQMELQRELELAESGMRPSRRDISSSTHNSRPRDRYRDRENPRSTNEGSMRADLANPTPSMSGTPVVLSGSRQFSGQLPTILQSRDRSDDCGSSYEENFDGSRDSGDTGSAGDPDPISALDGQSGGYGPGQRHGGRGGKSRQQIIDRRERDGRREGKWERKHY